MKRKLKSNKTTLASKGKPKQIFFPGNEFKNRIFFGGSLTTKRAHRVSRPLSTKYPIHLVFRSSQAQGNISFWKKENAQLIQFLIKKYSIKWGIKVLNSANVGNHLHLLIQISHRYSYEKFIRGFTGELSLRLTKWNKNLGTNPEKFWDYRPYSRVVIGQRARLTMNDYIAINQLEGLGTDRFQARMLLTRFSSA